MTTKELIYSNAIDLFSKHGYCNVGMRELAKNVGIKASSIYNHYKSKEDILLDIANKLIKEMSISVYPLYKRVSLMPRDFFTLIALETNRFFERTDIEQLIKLLIPEQFNHQPLKDLLHLEFIQKPRGALAFYFNELMRKGLMKKTDAILAAKTYHSFFLYHFYEKNLLIDPEGFLIKSEDTFINHINLFMDYFGIQ